MLGSQQYAVYRTVINHVLSDSERLPSLPSITIKIRKAMSEPNTTVHSLAKLISKDPALSALLIKSASSPLYRRDVAPKTLGDVISLLGFSTTYNLVMLHSVRSLFVLRSPVLKQLFSHTWQRLIVKTSVATLLAQKLSFRSVDQAQMAMLMTEVGSLAVLSALTEVKQLPDSDTYFQLCRNYSKSLGSILLNKWNIDDVFIKVVKQSGDWHGTWEQELSLIDIVNLSLYHAVLLTNKDATLPPLEQLAAFPKLPATFRQCAKPNWLSLVTDNRPLLQDIVNTFK